MTPIRICREDERPAVVSIINSAAEAYSAKLAERAEAAIKASANVSRRADARRMSALAKAVRARLQRGRSRRVRSPRLAAAIPQPEDRWIPGIAREESRSIVFCRCRRRACRRRMRRSDIGVDVAFGSQAEVTTLQDDFRFTPKQTRATSPYIGLHGGSDAAGFCHAVVDFVRKDEKNQNQIPSIGETQDSATFW